MKYYVKDIDKVIKQVEDKSSNSLLKCGIYLEKKIKEKISKDSYDTWTLSKSINTKQIDKNKVIVWTNLEYAIIREEWRRPWKFPPLNALVWRASRKWMITKNNATKRYNDLYYEDKGVIFVIARAIATRWIEWKHTFQKVVNAEKKNIINLYVKYMNWW